MRAITLDSGIKVSVLSFHYSFTSAYLEVGQEQRELHKEQLIESFLFNASKKTLWNGRKAHVIVPAIDRANQEGHWWPSCELSVLLFSSREISKEGLWSELGVIWFRDDFDHLPLRQVIHEAIHDLDWDGLAEEIA
jgi:hypothetical protein